MGSSGQACEVPRILVIDSYDSFVYNLVQYLGELGADPVVHRNDALTVDEALALEPDGVLLSPGPGRPETSGIICAAIPAFASRAVPVLGVCLGHQAIGHAFGATVERELVVADDVRLGAQLTQVLDEVVDEAVVAVDHQHASHAPSLPCVARVRS